MTAFTIRRATLALISAATLALPALADERELDRALQRYADCHWPEAFEAFVQLANDGDARAARIAVLMARHGTALYGRTFIASDTQIERWLVAAVAERPAR